MQKSRIFTLGYFAILLIAASTQVDAKNIDCRSCHRPNGTSGARDLTSYYYQRSDDHKVIKTFHYKHPSGIVFPQGLSADTKLKQPNASREGIAFFDDNRNKKPDDNEVQVFAAAKAAGKKSEFTVECSTCHIEHGKYPPSPDNPNKLYLRVSNEDSKLCLTCHKF